MLHFFGVACVLYFFGSLFSVIVGALSPRAQNLVYGALATLICIPVVALVMVVMVWLLSIVGHR